MSTDEAFAVIETKKKDIVAVGYSEHWQPNSDRVNASPLGSNVYAVKLDKSGKKVWVKSVGGKGNQRGLDVVEAKDGGLMIVGNTSESGGSSNILLMKMSANGDAAP